MRILIIGATSGIASAVARRYAGRGAALFLIGRNEARLRELQDELTERGADAVGSAALDLTMSSEHENVIATARAFLETIDTALICHGSLPDQQQCETDYSRAQREITVNGLSVISLLIVLARLFEEQQHGTLAVITSVAGDRGRRSNYVYGAAKSMVSTWLQGLRGRLHEHRVHVVDIRPGLVDSPMTAHIDKGLLWSSPEPVATRIVAAIDRRRHTVYAPGFWRIVMAVVRSIPDFLFKRLKF